MQMAEDGGVTSYRFEPLQRRGLLLGLGAGQLAVLGVAVLAALAFVKAWPATSGFLAASTCLVLAGLACRPVSGRLPLQWVGVAASFALRRRSVTLVPPASPPVPPRLRLPAKTFAPGVYLVELPAVAGQGPVGVILDERSGTAAALLRARGSSFCLLDGIDQGRKLAAWAAVLESVSSHRSSLARIQWCQRAVPADSDPLVAHLKRSGDPGSPGYRGHQSLLEASGQRAWRHETLLVLAVRAQGRGHRLSRSGGETLRNEVRALRARMHGAGIACDGLLDARGATVALGSFLVPSLERHPDAHPVPLAVKENWAEVRVDGYWHRTYWVAEWPRSRVGPIS